MVMVDHILVTEKFEKDVRKIRDWLIKERIDKVVKSILQNPDIGKPLRYGLKGEKTMRIGHYRLIYKVDGSTLILLRFGHRGDVYG